MAEQPLVTVFPGPGEDTYRVRVLLPDCNRTMTLHWTGNYDNAVDYIEEHCPFDEPVSPDEFRAAYKQCKGGK